MTPLQRMMFSSYVLVVCFIGAVISEEHFNEEYNYNNDFNAEEEETELTFEETNHRIKKIILIPLENINKEVIPQENVSDSLEVTMDFSLISVTNFDEISGEINMVAFLRLSWNAANLPQWNEKLLGGRASLTVPADSIWTPRMLVLNPAKSVKDLTTVSRNLRISNNRTVSWELITGVEAACGVDVTDFPFDTQTCSVNIAPWGYDSSEVRVKGRIDKSKDFLFTKNSAWTLSNTNVESVNVDKEWPYLRISLEITRLHEYFLMNVLIPPILLSILSPCVFILPASSGERMSFAVTCFLAFSVFMSMLSDNMPKSSVPISHLSYYMLYMLIHSCSVTISTVFTLRIYDKAENIKDVPRWLAVCVNALRFQFLLGECKSSRAEEKTDIDDRNSTETPIEQFTKADMISRHGSFDLQQMYVRKKYEQTDGRSWKDAEVTWYHVGKTLDMFFFVAYLSWMLFTVISFMSSVRII